MTNKTGTAQLVGWLTIGRKVWVRDDRYLSRFAATVTATPGKASYGLNVREPNGLTHTVSPYQLRPRGIRARIAVWAERIRSRV